MTETLPLLNNLVGSGVIYNFPGIYQIILIGTDRSYVGRSLSAGGRLRAHATALVAGSHPNYKLQSAWNDHGADSFQFQLLEKVDVNEIAKAEQRWTAHFKAASIGFNIAPQPARPGGLSTVGVGSASSRGSLGRVQVVRTCAAHGGRGS